MRRGQAEGGKIQAHILRALVERGYPYCLPIGLTPHTMDVRRTSKSRAKPRPRGDEDLGGRLAIQDAGCLCWSLRRSGENREDHIRTVDIPTIGIGAGVGRDGQILLCYDLLGVFTDFKPKFTKRYGKLTEVAVAGIEPTSQRSRPALLRTTSMLGVDETEYEKLPRHGAKRRQV